MNKLSVTTVVFVALLLSMTGAVWADQVIWSGTVSGNGTRTNPVSLKAGETYVLEVSGWMVIGRLASNGQDRHHDPLYEFDNSGKMIKPGSLSANSLGIKTSGNYNTGHVYRSAPFKSDGKSLVLWVQDGRYDDNKGGLSAKVILVSSDQSAGNGAVPLNQLVSLQSINYRDRYIRHQNFLGELTVVKSGLDKKDATFWIRPGLADPNGVSFESVNYPGYFLRHQGFRLKLHKRENNDLFKKDATFKWEPGLASPKGVSFQSVNFPKRYLRHKNFHLFLENGNNDLFKKDVTFLTVKPFVDK